MSGRFWWRKARLLAARVNAARALDWFLPGALAVSVVFAATLLVLRKMDAPLEQAWFGYAALLLVCVVIGCVGAWRKRFTAHDALVRLDDMLHLKNRLTAAAAGVGDWPEPRRANAGLRWDAVRILSQTAVAIAVVSAAILVPIVPSPSAATVQPPIAWTQLAAWIDQLSESDVLDQQSLETLREQLANLQRQSPEEWYRHSSLEAGDSLRQETEQSLRALQKNLEAGADALAAIEKAHALDASALKRLGDVLDQARSGLELGALPLNKELLEKLKGLDLSKLKQLTPEQLAQLKAQLQKGAGVCENCVGGGERDKDLEALMALIGRERGSGGPGGGGKSAPLSLKQRPTDLGSKTSEPVPGDDLSRAAPGDVLGLSSGEHEVDRGAWAGPVPAGQIPSDGTGGEAVWRHNLSPQERAVLQRFFK